MLKIGSLKLKSKLILAPMAGISDLPYRMLYRRFGAELCFVEMINARSISHKSKRTKSMLATGPKDKPLGMQLLGCEPVYIRKAMDVLAEYKFDVLDFNCACPAKKVARRGEGASLLKDPKKIQALLKIIVENAKTPVTAKIRIGWDRDSINARDVALVCQDSGINALFVHGRTKMDAYSGKVDYSVIRQVKKALNIPVIASGDIFSSQVIIKVFDETGVDGVAVARGALGNPWIFTPLEKVDKECNSLTGFTDYKPDTEEVIKVMLEHLKSCVDFYGERVGVVKFRKFFGWYTKGMRKARPLRGKSSQSRTHEEMVGIIGKCLETSRRGHLNVPYCNVSA